MGLKQSGPVWGGLPPRDGWITSRKRSFPETSNFSTDFHYENVSQNESWGFWKGVDASARLGVGRVGKEEAGDRETVY